MQIRLWPGTYIGCKTAPAKGISIQGREWPVQDVRGFGLRCGAVFPDSPFLSCTALPNSEGLHGWRGQHPFNRYGSIHCSRGLFYAVGSKISDLEN